MFGFHYRLQRYKLFPNFANDNEFFSVKSSFITSAISINTGKDHGVGSSDHFSPHHLLSVPDIHPMLRLRIKATALEVEEIKSFLCDCGNSSNRQSN